MTHEWLEKCWKNAFHMVVWWPWCWRKQVRHGDQCEIQWPVICKNSCKQLFQGSNWNPGDRELLRVWLSCGLICSSPWFGNSGQPWAWQQMNPFILPTSYTADMYEGDDGCSRWEEWGGDEAPVTGLLGLETPSSHQIEKQTGRNDEMLPGEQEEVA